jgi:hypothetical protein
VVTPCVFTKLNCPCLLLPRLNTRPLGLVAAQCRHRPYKQRACPVLLPGTFAATGRCRIHVPHDVPRGATLHPAGKIFTPRGWAGTSTERIVNRSPIQSIPGAKAKLTTVSWLDVHLSAAPSPCPTLAPRLVNCNSFPRKCWIVYPVVTSVLLVHTGSASGVKDFLGRPLDSYISRVLSVCGHNVQSLIHVVIFLRGTLCMSSPSLTLVLPLTPPPHTTATTLLYHHNSPPDINTTVSFPPNPCP